jgi:hypothetical protein
MTVVGLLKELFEVHEPNGDIGLYGAFDAEDRLVVLCSGSVFESGTRADT